MKVTRKVVIPKGWRRLRVGEIIRKKDRYANPDDIWTFAYSIGHSILAYEQEDLVFIRKVEK